MTCKSANCILGKRKCQKALQRTGIPLNLSQSWYVFVIFLGERVNTGEKPLFKAAKRMASSILEYMEQVALNVSDIPRFLA